VKLPGTGLSLKASYPLNTNAFVNLNFVPSHVKDIHETVENRIAEDEVTDFHNPLKALTMTARKFSHFLMAGGIEQPQVKDAVLTECQVLSRTIWRKK
jgi:hypothetical protein